MKTKTQLNLIIILLVIANVLLLIAIIPDKPEMQQVSEEEIREIELEIEEQIEEQVQLTGAELYRDMLSKEIDNYNLHTYKALIIAISRLETGNWKAKSFTEYKNWGGITIGGEVVEYANLGKGLEAYMITIEWYIDNGMNTPETIGKKYCPANYENWVKAVNQIMFEEMM